MEYAVIKASGKQHKISEGDILTLDRQDFAGKKSIVFDEVLLVANGTDVKIGNPTVKNAVVEASFVEDKKGDKLRVSKFKAKSRYRKTIGFRPLLTVVKIEKIKIGTSKSDNTDNKTNKTTKTASKVKES